ncbi:MAG: N-6 DNA methylase [Proteobacteria bacterium]|nr:N-6 DNA methylase [Pseudomonadota bacterium]
MAKKSVSYSTLFSVDSTSFKNEAQVETRFAEPLFKEMGYPKEAILPKERVAKLIGYEGTKKKTLEVDFLLIDPDGFTSIVVEAKSPSEDISSHWGQAASYALSHNQSLKPGERGIEWLLLTNGLMTALYPHDRSTPLVTLRLEDFSSGSPPFITLKNYIRYKTRKQRKKDENVFETIPPDELNALFDDCHNLIWKKEKLSPTDAFYEFCKFVFIKIREDKKRQILNDDVSRNEIPLTMEWLKSSEKTSIHPLRDILFIQLRNELEDSIKKGKKRIFDKDEKIRLGASTCKELMLRFENVNLSAIDEDLNGRMFERFLNQAVRGKELGQYFTPRPVVDFMTRIALHGCDITNPPRVIDACAGTGGFLIEVMAYLIAAARNDKRLTNKDKEVLVKRVCDEHLFGVEGNERVSRVARINMYLHGDGGSHIFHGDGLDSDPLMTDDITSERRDEVTDHISKLTAGSFDLVLTNPPFSMSYNADNEDESRILGQRKIATGLKNVKSNLLFLDRYHELLKPGGEILIVIDDTILNGKTQVEIRKWILEKFILLGVHSLPFNAFFKAQANIKTSIIHLRKKQDSSENQGHIFMSITNNIGHDSHSKDTPERNNLVDILMMYFDWKRTGEFNEVIRQNQDCYETLECPQQVWLLPPEKLKIERFDSFYYSPDLRNIRKEIKCRVRKEEVKLYYGCDFKTAKKISKKDKDEFIRNNRILKYIEIGDVTPYGLIVKHIEGTLNELPSRGQYQVKQGDVLIAINNSSRGTVVLVPEGYDGAICTSGFLVIRPDSVEQGKLLWYVLRSEYSRAQIYYLAQTASQPELKNDVWKNEFMIPMPLCKLRDQALSEVKTFMRHVSALNEANNVRLH